MYQRILVPLDGSPVAEAALEVAFRLLPSEGGELLLVRMQEYSKEARSSEIQIVSDAFDIEKNRCNDYLALVAERWRSPRCRVLPQVLDHDSRTARVLARSADLSACNLVVLTSHGRSGLERALLGSVAEEMARICSRPVLILGPKTPEVQRIKDELQAMSNR